MASTVLTEDRAEQMRAAFADLERIRAEVVDDALEVEAATDRYATMIDVYIDAIGQKLSTYTGQTSFIAGFTALARFQDRAAVETGAGLSGFAYGEVGRDRAELIIASRAEQRTHANMFRSTADGAWIEEFNRLLARMAGPELEQARAHLIEAGFSGEPPNDAHRSWWRETRIPLHYDLSVLRNRYAQNGVRARLEEARAHRDGVVRMAVIQLVLIAMAFAASVLGMVQLAGAARRAHKAQASESEAELTPAE